MPADAVAATPPVESGDGGGVADFTVVIVGAGFAGLGMAMGLIEAGIDDFTVLEKAQDVGGVWRENSYPGCRCDVPSHLYSYSFAPNPDWSSRFSGQAEIWDYLRRVARERGADRRVRFDHEMLAASWEQSERRWRIETNRGELTARVLVTAIGQLHEVAIPELPGIERFQGVAFHSATWDHDYPLEGKSVAVIGTGASAIQFVPKIQPQVAKLHVFQRTAPWVLPRHDRPIGAFARRLHRAWPWTQTAKRSMIYLMRESLLIGFAKLPRLMPLAEWVSRVMIARQITDAELRRKVRPTFKLGCKRVLLADDYYPALDQPNVDLITSDVKEIREHSIIDGDGIERQVDAIIYGTGFHVTDTAIGHLVTGRDGMTLDQQWQGSPRAYLGTAVPGFPNLFLLTGPNTSIAHTSLIFLAESHIRYVVDCLRTMRVDALETVEVKPDAWNAYSEEMQRRSKRTVWLTGGCSSWYLDRNGLNTVLYPDFTFKFRWRTRRFDSGSYITSTTRAESMVTLSVRR